LASKAFGIAEPETSKGDILTVFDLRRKTVLFASSFHLIGEVMRTLHKNPHRTSELYQLSAGELPPAELADGIVDPGRIEFICSINAFQGQNAFSMEEQAFLEGSSGVWIYPSFINHSCVGNVNRVFYGDVMMIRALRDLRAGEEIELSYVGNSSDRREKLLKAWSINCNCAWCQQDNATSLRALNQRKYLLEHRPAEKNRKSVVLERWVRELNATYKPGDQFRLDITTPLITLMSAYMTEGKRRETIAIGRQFLGIQPPSILTHEVQFRMAIAYAQLLMGQCDSAKKELKEMLNRCWKYAGVNLTEVRILAAAAIEAVDPEGALSSLLNELEEEQRVLLSKEGTN
jgi:hypothetical protein